MNSRADSDFRNVYTRWRDANAAAFEAAERVFEARKRWARGCGELPTEEQIEEAYRLREVADRLLKAASNDQMTRPAPL